MKEKKEYKRRTIRIREKEGRKERKREKKREREKKEKKKDASFYCLS